MIDGLNEGTGDASLEAAAAAIAGLLSEEPEEQQKREAPPRKPAEPVEEEQDETDSEGDTAQPEEEVEPDEQEDEDTEPTKPEPRKLRVKVDGEELELPEDEVVKGYSRTKDYTQKTQKLAEERKAFEAEAVGVRAERQRYATQLAQLEQVLKESTPAEPDWDTLRNGDPGVFAATYAAWDQHQKSIERVAAERSRADEKVRADTARAFQSALQEEHTKLLEAIPTWSDPEVAKREKAELIEYATSHGYSAEEVGQVTDHRLIKILRDAASHQRVQKRAPAIEKKIEKARVLAPGSNTTPKREVSDLTKAKQALAKTGSERDAGRAISLLLDMD